MSIALPALLWFTNAGFLFGGAKPVPVNPRNYKNFKRGDIIVSMAGIVTNVALAFICTILIAVVGLVARAVGGGGGWVGTVQYMLLVGIRLNLVLAMFNLLPIPPLDGSHVMKYLLPPAWSLRYQAIGGGGIIILLVIFMFKPDLILIWLGPALSLSQALILSVRGFIFPSFPG